MNNQEAYNQWASSYDETKNLTRDLEGLAKQQVLAPINFQSVLELGCGTGKNTAWLLQKARQVTSVDFSEQMLAKAKETIKTTQVNFVQANITEPWTFVDHQFDLITCSLILEHISSLETIFQQAAKILKGGGHFYIGELHPFKQYAGSKARFEKDNQTLVLDCYTHHISTFTQLAIKNNFAIVQLQEWFDEGNTGGIPRILTLLLKKTNG